VSRAARRLLALVAALAGLAALAPALAVAEFPYPTAPSNPGDFTQYRVTDALITADSPDDLRGKLDWMYSATPEDPGSLPDPLVAANNASPFELGGVRGAHLVDPEDSVETAWETTTGRPDVAIAVLDSGIKWNDRGAMIDLRRKTRISRGEARRPDHLRTAPLEPLPAGMDCADFADAFDANRDGVFNVSDYACDSRVEISPAARTALGQPAGVGPADLLDPQDVLIAFTDGVDDDGNGYRDDMVGWDFLDDDNDPYDDVQYGHGTGEARDSTAEAANNAAGGGELASCPNCMGVHMRVGDSFIADVNRFAQATIYAADNDVLVVQSALGTLNNSRLARAAVKYAYDRGVTIVVSAADEAAQHNNQPSLPYTILVNSVTQYDVAATPLSRSYLQFNGCTNFNSKITLAIPSVSCSSDAVGRASGMAGLIISAAANAVEAGDLDPHPTCERTNGDPCPITPNEVRQLMASGTVDGQTQADDVDFSESELTCPAPGCTDPFLGAPPERTVTTVSPLPTTRSYPAREGHDQFYGYGRVNMLRATRNARAGVLPPEVELTSPEWYELVDPNRDLAVRGTVWARGETYTCQVYVAPGAYPNDAAGEEGDFREVDAGECDGEQEQTAALDGLLGNVDAAALKARFPPGTASGPGLDFDGREPGASPMQPYSGRPNTAPYGFVVKVVARTVQDGAGPGGADRVLEGEDRRQAFLHRDRDLLPAFPRELLTDGASSPLFVDLDGDNRNELVFGTSDGYVHALRRDGSDLPGWPVRGDRLPLHLGAPAFAGGEVSSDFGGAILASPAAGDLDRDGVPEIVAADLEGKVYVWNTRGERVFTRETNIAFSGKPLSPFVDVRKGRRNRTQHGFIGSPVLADLDGDGRLEIVAAAMDRHLYAWRADGSPVDGFPVLLVDRTKVASVDPVTHAVTFDPAKAGDELDQGGIVDTPAVANLVGDPDSPPEIIIGTNEEYKVEQGNEGPFNAGPANAAAINALQQAGSQAGLDVADANGRLYAVHAAGESHPGGPLVEGWPVKLGLLMAQLLPVVGEGVNGSPVVAPLTCPSGGAGNKVGVIPAAGLGYIFNADGTSCLGRSDGRDNALQSDVADGKGLDATRFPAVGLPAFGTIGGQTAFIAPVAGLVRALDLAFNEYQGGFDGVAAWNPQSGQYLPNFPAQVNDLQFLTGPAVGDVGGQPGEEIVAGTASMDLQAFSAAGAPTSDRWPRLHGDWMVATPLIGSFGQKETEADARQVVVALTRRGTLFAYDTPAAACSPASSPRFHHDNHNSGDFRRDAVAPGAPENLRVGGSTLGFAAPGDDLLCGIADRYQVVQSDSPIDGASFASAQPVGALPDPGEPGSAEAVLLPSPVKRYLAVRAVDEQGNVGRTVALDTAAPAPGGGTGVGGAGGGGPGAGGGGSGTGDGTGRGGSPTGNASRPCLPRRLRVTSTRVGRVRLGARLTSVKRRYRVLRSGPRATRLCVRGGGRFLVVARRGRVRLIVSTARGHRVRGAGPAQRRRGAALRVRRVRRGLLVGTRGRRGRVIYGVRRGRFTFVGATRRADAGRPGALIRRLRALGLG